MASSKVTAIVIGGTDVKEKDRIINLFTLEKGVIPAVLRGVRGNNAKLKSAKDVFSMGEFILEEGNHMAVITGFEMVDNFYNLTTNLDKYYEACCLLDIVNKAVKEPSSRMFYELIKALKVICYDNVRKYYCVDKFLLTLFDDAGYGFISNKCSGCGQKLKERFFNVDIGAYVCDVCRNSQALFVPETCAAAIKLISSTDYDKLKTVKFAKRGEEQAYNLLKYNFFARYGESLMPIDPNQII